MSGVPQAMQGQRFHRDVAHALNQAGFTIADAWHGGRHLRVRVAPA